MGKFYGNVGYAVSVEQTPGIFRNVEKVIPYYGDYKTLRTSWSSQSTSTLDDCTMNLEIDICADAYALEHFMHIKWVEYEGVKLKVTSVTPRRPRIVLNVGGVYAKDQT